MGFDIDYCMAFVDVPIIIRYYLPEWEPNRKVKCRWHAETQSSLSIDERGFGQCFGCGMKISNIFDLAAKADTGKGKAGYQSWKKYALEWYKQFNPTIDASVIKEYQEHLHSPEGSNAFKYLTGDRRQLQEKTIEAYGLGWDPETDRVTIPFYDLLGNVINIKKFLYRKDQEGAKAISYSRGHGSTRIYPELRTTLHNELVLCEGEWDVLTLLQNDIPAITWTNGANSWDRRSTLLLRKKKLVVCYDADPGGELGLSQLKKNVASIPKEELPPQLYPLSPPAPPSVRGKDVSEWVHSSPEILAVIRDALQHDVRPTRKLNRKTVAQEFQKVRASFEKHFHIEDPYGLDVIFGTMAANRFPHDMVWLVQIAPAGGLKTEVMRSMGECDWVREISRITGKTLFSGYKKDKRANLEESSLAFKLRGKFVVHKDMTSLTEMRREGLNDVLSQFRELYDGHVPADWGIGEGVRWTGKFGFLGAITPRVDYVIDLQSKVGERFLYYRSIEGNEILSTKQALMNATKRDAIRSEIAKVVADFLNEYFTDPVECPEFPEKFFEEIMSMANVVSWGRASVPRTGIHSDMAGRPIRERSTRAVGQLCLLAQGIALLNGDRGISKRTWDIIRRVSFSSMPALRRCSLLYLNEHPDASVTEVANYLRMEIKYVKKELANCWSLGLADRLEHSAYHNRDLSENDILRENRTLYIYRLNEQGQRYIDRMRGDSWKEIY